MKTNQRNVIRAYAALNQLGRTVTGKTAFALFRMKQKLKPVIDFQAEEEMKLIEKHGGTVTEDGRITIEDQKERQLFQKEHEELGNIECDVDPIKLPIDDLPGITMDEIEALDGFIEFE